MLPIVQLVREAKAAIEQQEGRSLSLRDLAAITGIKYGTLRRYHDPDLEPMQVTARPQTMQQFAAGLGLPLSVVQEAFVRSTSYADVEGPATEPDTIMDWLGQLIDWLHRLGPEEREVRFDQLVSWWGR